MLPDTEGLVTATGLWLDQPAGVGGYQGITTQEEDTKAMKNVECRFCGHTFVGGVTRRPSRRSTGTSVVKESADLMDGSVYDECRTCEDLLRVTRDVVKQANELKKKKKKKKERENSTVKKFCGFFCVL